MKRFIIILLSLCIALPLYSQRKKSRKGSVIKWLSVGVKGGGGGAFMYNSNLLNDDKVDINFASPSYFYGGRFGITIGDYISVFSELCSAGYHANYTLNDVGVNSLSYDKSLKMKTTDYAFTFRFTALTGAYVELGPKFTNLKNIEEQNELVEATSVQPTFYTESNRYNEKITSGIFGFGISPVRTDRFDMTLGLRFNVGFTDTFKEIDSNPATPLNDGYYEYDVDFSDSYLPAVKTNLISAQVVVELNYTFGFWGDASCGKNRLMLFK